MKVYTDIQMERIREATFKAGYQSALLGNLNIKDDHYTFDHHDNFKNWVPDIDKRSIVEKVIMKVFSYFTILTDPKTAYDIIFKDVTKALEGIKPIE